MAAVVLGAGLAAPLSAVASAAGSSDVHAQAAGKKVKKVCRLVTDATDDAKNAAGSGNPSLDIISADVATNATTLTAVIRVAKLTSGFDPQAPLGRSWQLGMAVPGANAGQLVVGVVDGPFGTRDANGLGGKVTLDPKTNSVIVSESLAKLASSFHAHILRGKTRISQFVAQGTAVVQEPNAGGLTTVIVPGGAADYAPNAGVSAATYLAGAPSCVRVGS
jgi:hypothetical protein